MKRIYQTVLFVVIVFFASAQIPEEFDLRNYNGKNYVSPVKSQIDGTCWTHGAMAAIEGNLLMNGNWETSGLDNPPNLAEYHLDWWNGFNDNYNADIEPTSGSGLEVHMGGDYRVTAAYLARGNGSVKDGVEGNWHSNTPENYNSDYTFFYVRDIEWYIAGENLERINVLKQKIMDNGVMGTCMAYDNQFISNYIHYQPPTSDMLPNHAIAIIGWDDNKQTQAPESGAWLCKNSWDIYWGNDGYFWISYYDKWSGQEPEMGAISMINTVEQFFDTIYYHDYHGWRDTKSGVNEAINAFTAENTIEIKSLSFFTADDTVNYTAAVYDDFNGAELTNLLAEISGSIDHTGFHTFDLDEVVSITQGNDFYIYLNLDKGGMPFDRTSDVPVLLGGTNTRTIVESSAQTGQSFYKNTEGSWTDFYYEGEDLWINSGNFCMKAIVDNKSAQIPEEFDLRNYNGKNYVSPVKSQIDGTCWTHGAMAAIEGNLLMNGNWETSGLDNPPNLAEYHLDWWNGFNDNYNADIEPTSGSGLEVHMGGDYRVTAAYLARGNGSVKDGVEGNWHSNTPENYNSDYTFFYVRDIEWYIAGENLERINVLKQKIMDNGVMGTCMAYDNQFISNYIHYQPPTSDMLPNHAIAIIGWDDNKQTQAPESGAWLCKNSWDIYWGNDGYFWISYYDKWSGQEPEMGAISMINTVEQFFDTIYYHDYHGWRDTKSGVNEAINAFTAENTIEIKSLSFFTADDTVNYTAAVYDDFNGAELTNLLAEISGSIDHTGFHTFDLDEVVSITQGNDFYIYLNLDKGGMPFDRTSDVPVLLGGTNTRTIVESSAQTGQSFFKNTEGSWIDFYSEGDALWLNSGNFCMKAIVDNKAANTSGISENTAFINNSISLIKNPVTNYAEFKTQQEDIVANKIAVYDVQGKLILQQKLSKKSNFSVDLSQVNSGIYFYRIYTNYGIASGKIIRK
ncbi:MAG: T9SS type A sorting domain-containing protein [Salinivirgaceae bacterium]|nr:T9SS type A sorting domain-containing protein [Salinivirgaceae bacterium]